MSYSTFTSLKDEEITVSSIYHLAVLSVQVQEIITINSKLLKGE